MKIVLAKRAGFCFGVKRAIEIAEKSPREKCGPIYTLGPLIHNKQVVQELEDKGISVANLDEVDHGSFIIRSHGVSPKVIRKAQKQGMKLIDATCPFVKKAQELAQDMYKGGYKVIVVGDKDHPEVVGIVGWTKDTAIVVENPEEAKTLPKCDKIGVIAQTTQPRENFESVVNVLKEKTTNLKIHNTICHATGERQRSAKELSESVDIMIVIGGLNSANTRKLATICSETGTSTYHIEKREDLKSEWFANVQKIGLTAGASTPDWIIEEVKEECQKLKKK